MGCGGGLAVHIAQRFEHLEGLKIRESGAIDRDARFWGAADGQGVPEQGPREGIDLGRGWACTFQTGRIQGMQLPGERAARG